MLITSQNSPAPFSVIAQGCLLHASVPSHTKIARHFIWILSHNLNSFLYSFFKCTHCFFFLSFILLKWWNSLCFHAHTVLQCMDKLHSVYLPSNQWIFGFTFEAIMINLAMNICTLSVIKTHGFSYFFFLSRIPKSRIIGENVVCIYFSKSCHTVFLSCVSVSDFN